MPKVSSAGNQRRRGKMLWMIAGLLVIVGLGAYALIARPWEPRPLMVKMETLVRGPLSQVLAVNGRVAARRSVILRSTVQARLVSVSADIGDTVVAKRWCVAELLHIAA